MLKCPKVNFLLQGTSATYGDVTVALEPLTPPQMSTNWCKLKGFCTIMLTDV